MQMGKNIKLDPSETGCKNMNWIILARDVGPVEGFCGNDNGGSGRKKGGDIFS
jgi:hypothetical protein